VTAVVSIDEAGAMALELPEVTEGEYHDRRTWSVEGKTFAWERPFSKADIRRFGAADPPEEPILAVRVEDLSEKEGSLQAGHPGVFTIPHFDGHAAVLVELGAASEGSLREVILDGWLACAPSHLAEAYLADHSGPTDHHAP
jgi:hypothetical protein